MNFFRFIVFTSTSLIYTAGASAQDQVDHKAHHPEAASASAKSNAIIAKPIVAKDTIKEMVEQLKMMSNMHEKMMNAKTPEERSALMGDHMKAMQAGMSMMNNMNKTDTEAKNKMKGMMPADMDMHQMMEKRMEMMVAMMQMMMDRMPVPAPASKK
jgi:hypothetical protein